MTLPSIGPEAIDGAGADPVPALRRLHALTGHDAWEIVVDSANGDAWDEPALRRALTSPNEKAVVVVLATGDAFALHARTPRAMPPLTTLHRRPPPGYTGLYYRDMPHAFTFTGPFLVLRGAAAGIEHGPYTLGNALYATPMLVYASTVMTSAAPTARPVSRALVLRVWVPRWGADPPNALEYPFLVDTALQPEEWTRRAELEMEEITPPRMPARVRRGLFELLTGPVARILVLERP